MADEKPKTHQQALERFKLATEAIQKQLEREKEDLAFQVPEEQWPEAVKQTRQGQVIAGVPLPPRPMLSLPSLDQPIQLILNQERAAHLGVQVHPLSEDADDDTAEILQGLYRRIEVDSRANLARTWAYERAVKAGRGAYRVNTVYDKNSDHIFDQCIVIQRLLHQESAVFDPFAQEPDWSDGRYAFVTSWIPWDRYTQKYPDSLMSGMDEGELVALTEAAPEWMTGDGESRAVLIAEYWRVEIDYRKHVLLDDGSTVPDDEIPEGRSKVEGKARDVEICRVVWSTINGIETLEEDQEWNGQYIPLIPVIGRELIPYNQERRWVGVIGPNKDAARLINFSASGAVEMAALETKAPYLLAEGQEEGHEQEFALANVRNFPYLRYKPTTIAGTPNPPPQRTQIDTSRLSPSMTLLETGRELVRMGTGAYEPSLGQDSSRAKSGRSILALQQQHDQGTSHFLDNLAELSMTYEAKVILDLICGDKRTGRTGVYDRPGRILRILDQDTKQPQTVMLNKPFVLQNGRPMPLAAQPGQPLPDGAQHFDLTKGRYGVVVSVGKAYRSRLEEGNDMLAQLFQAEPQLFGILGDIWLEFQSWPGHQEAAERIKKMLPPPLQQQDQQNAAGQAAALQGQLQQMGQQLQQAQQYIQSEQAKHQATIAKARIDAETTLRKQEMQDATAIAVAQINAAAKGVQLATEAQNEALATGREHAYDAVEAQRQRQHEIQLAAQQHAQALQQAREGAAQGFAQAEQGQQHALEQGDQSGQQALQQLAAQPQPTNGNGGGE